MKTTLKILLLSFAVLSATFTFAQSDAIYTISVTTTWNAGDHTSVPGSAHWSNFIGATHSTPNKFMSIGSLATTGIKNVAEIGSNGFFRGEINNAIINDGDADQLLEDLSDTLSNSPTGTISFSNITVSEDFPLISLVSMVAPSPDWFVAVNSETLRSGNPTINNGWKDDYTMDVFVYDSGTDDGTNYGSSNSASSPFVPISMATGFPTNGIAMATISFDYVSSTLSIADVASVENVKVYPNPAKDVLYISNIIGNDLESAELYNVLGKRANVTTVSNGNDITIDTSALQSGIYILKLNAAEGASATRKVIIQ